MNHQPTMVHHRPLPQRRMGVSIGPHVFATVEAAQMYLEVQALDSRLRRLGAHQQPAMAGGDP